MAKAAKASWKNRIVGQGEKPAGEFKFNPLNWRKHPESQQRALATVLSEVGWVQNVIVNRNTGNLIDGHARIEEALKLGESTSVPFVEVELTEEEERKILAVFDSISKMAEPDIAMLEELLGSIEDRSGELNELLISIANSNGIAPDFEPATIDEQGKLDELNLIKCPNCNHEFSR